MADLATLQQRLAEAETALHLLLSGKTAVEVNDGRRTVRYSYSPLSMDQLQQYVVRLKAEVAAAKGEPSRRAVGVKF